MSSESSTVYGLEKALEDIYVHLYAADRQSLPSDDQIIMQHVREALAITKHIREMLASHDPVRMGPGHVIY